MTKRQSIFRASHSKKNPYFQMLRTTAQDSTLSFEARGVIAYLLSQDEKWEINKADLMKRGGIGTTKMKRIVDELIEKRYMTRTQENVKGKFEKVIYTLYEEPQPQNAIADTSPEPLTRKPRAEKPQAENARQDIIKGKEDKGGETTIDQKIAPDGAKGKDNIDPVGEYYRDMATVEPKFQHDEPIGPPPPPKPADIVDAWYDGMPAAPKKRKYPRNVACAKRILEDEWLPEQVKLFVEAKYTEPYWQGKLLKLETVEEDLPLWWAANAPPEPIPVQVVPVPKWMLSCGLVTMEDESHD